MRIPNIYLFAIVAAAGACGAAPSASADPGLCASEIEFRAKVLEYRQQRLAARESTKPEVLAAENELLAVRYRCGALEESEFTRRVLANHAALVAVAAAEHAAGSLTRMELDSVVIAELDFKWRVIAISTLDYCNEKFILLATAWRAVRGELVAARSQLLEAELAVQKHREFCALEGTIELPELE